MKRFLYLVLLLPLVAVADERGLGRLLHDATKHLRTAPTMPPSGVPLGQPGPDVLEGYTRITLQGRTWDHYLLGAALLPERPIKPSEWEMYVAMARESDRTASVDTIKARIAQLAATRRFYFDGLVTVAWSEDLQLAVLTQGKPLAQMPPTYKRDDVAYVLVPEGPRWTSTPLHAYRPDTPGAGDLGTWGRSWQASVRHARPDVLWNNIKLSRTFFTVGEPQFMQVDIGGQRIYRLPLRIDRVEYSDQVRTFVYTEKN